MPTHSTGAHCSAGKEANASLPKYVSRKDGRENDLEATAGPDGQSGKPPLPFRERSSEVLKTYVFHRRDGPGNGICSFGS